MTVALHINPLATSQVSLVITTICPALPYSTVTQCQCAVGETVLPGRYLMAHVQINNLQLEDAIHYRMKMMLVFQNDSGYVNSRATNSFAEDKWHQFHV